MTADGNTRLMLVARSSNPGRMRFILSNREETAVGFGLETLGRSVAKTDPEGNLVLELDPVSVDVLGANGEDCLYQGTAVLVAPADFPARYQEQSDIQVPLEVSQYGEDRTTVLEGFQWNENLSLFRSPVIFIHGLNGDEDRFGSIAQWGSIFDEVNAYSLVSPLSFKYEGHDSPAEINKV